MDALVMKLWEGFCQHGACRACPTAECCACAADRPGACAAAQPHAFRATNAAGIGPGGDGGTTCAAGQMLSPDADAGGACRGGAQAGGAG